MKKIKPKFPDSLENFTKLELSDSPENPYESNSILLPKIASPSFYIVAKEKPSPKRMPNKLHHTSMMETSKTPIVKDIPKIARNRFNNKTEFKYSIRLFSPDQELSNCKQQRRNCLSVMKNHLLNNTNNTSDIQASYERRIKILKNMFNKSRGEKNLFESENKAKKLNSTTDRLPINLSLINQPQNPENNENPFKQTKSIGTKLIHYRRWSQMRKRDSQSPDFRTGAKLPFNLHKIFEKHLAKTPERSKNPKNDPPSDNLRKSNKSIKSPTVEKVIESRNGKKSGKINIMVINTGIPVFKIF